MLLIEYPIQNTFLHYFYQLMSEEKVFSQWAFLTPQAGTVKDMTDEKSIAQQSTCEQQVLLL